MSRPMNARARSSGPDPVELGVPWPALLERQLEWVGPGAHIGCICSSRAERLRVLGAFFRGGLRHGQKCVYFAAPDRARELIRSLRPLEVGQAALEVVTSRDEYVPSDRHH